MQRLGWQPSDVIHSRLNDGSERERERERPTAESVSPSADTRLRLYNTVEPAAFASSHVVLASATAYGF